jgi:hypothetical protein
MSSFGITDLAVNCRFFKDVDEADRAAGYQVPPWDQISRASLDALTESRKRDKP